MNTFQNILFAKIDRINNDGDYPVYWFRKPLDVQPQDHKYTRDKTPFGNCYSDLEEGKHYIIQLEEHKIGKKTRWVWVECVEIPTANLWRKAFQYWYKDKDLANAIEASGIKDYLRAEKQKQQKTKNIDDLLIF